MFKMEQTNACLSSPVVYSVKLPGWVILNLKSTTNITQARATMSWRRPGRQCGTSPTRPPSIVNDFQTEVEWSFSFDAKRSVSCSSFSAFSRKIVHLIIILFSNCKLYLNSQTGGQMYSDTSPYKVSQRSLVYEIQFTNDF